MKIETIASASGKETRQDDPMDVGAVMMKGKGKGKGKFKGKGKGFKGGSKGKGNKGGKQGKGKNNNNNGKGSAVEVVGCVLELWQKWTSSKGLLV